MVEFNGFEGCAANLVVWNFIHYTIYHGVSRYLIDKKWYSLAKGAWHHFLLYVNRLKKKKKKLIWELAQISFVHFSSSFTQFFLFLFLSLVTELVQSPPTLSDSTSHKLAAWAASCNFARNIAVSSLLFLSQFFRVKRARKDSSSF